MINVDGVGVRFYFDRHLKVVTRGAARFRRHGSTKWGVRDVSFRTAGGEGIALIGPSGSGKTTMLRLLARVYWPDEGRLLVRGRVSSLLSIDAGLLALLTGRENAMLLGVLGGLSRRASRRAVESVKERSRLGDAFEQPVSTYSQGMRARLGFAVAEETQPQILLLDEVHEALDHEFRAVVAEHARRLVEAGGVVVASGHDHQMLGRLCTRAIHLDQGSIRADGPFAEVQPAYLSAVHARAEA
ncbi:MAG: ATP-binding cassette domain-containing protein [Actinomycetota bacterium]|nr:ATP-binding cassette domain-containing protein [Actinomycetota bacterium]